MQAGAVVIEHNALPLKSRLRTSTAAVPFAERISCTPKEAVSATGIRLTKLYDLMALKGDQPARIRSTKVDGKRLILVSSLRQFIEGDQPINSLAK